MAVNDFSTLCQGVADWLARADLASQIPTFVALAEARINRELRTRQMQTAVSGSVASNVITLPTDCRAVQSLRIASGSQYAEIHPLPPERLADTSATGFPAGYVVVNGSIK